MTDPVRPLCILIAALGGEGGGVLTQWLVQAATRQGFPVQSTSIPGVAQRTGATTYYIELYPVSEARLDGRGPVLALYPCPGGIDVMIASEWLEVGRALAAGYVSPDRTLLIGSTHRIYSIDERSAMSDGRYDDDAIRVAAHRLAQRSVLLDFAALARDHGAPLNAVLLGALAGREATPISPASFEAAIRSSGIAVDRNLAGFRAGATQSSTEPVAVPGASPPPESASAPAGAADVLISEMRAAFPAEVQAVIETGIERLIDYQDERYACDYVDRLKPILAADQATGHGTRRLTRETARHLALWMSYEDVIRVAGLKICAQRWERLYREVDAKPGEPVHVTEFMKPGVEEVAALLPPSWGRALRDWAQRHELDSRLQFSMRVKTHTVFGFLRLYLLARLQGRRRNTLRFQEESQLIDQWLTAIGEAVGQDYALALEITACANLNKGYSDTFRRGRGHYQRLFAELVEPALRGAPVPGTATRLRQAREAALADPEGCALDALLAEPEPATSH